MDPLTIASTCGSVASLCVKTIYTLTKWGHEVAGIDTLISGLRGEIEAVQNVVASLDTARSGELSTSFTDKNNERPLWAQIGKSIADAHCVLQALDKILLKFDARRSGVFAKVVKQFKMSLESGEIASLRQRLALITSALNLPLQMLSLQLHVERAEKDNNLAEILSEKINDMETSITAIHSFLTKQDKMSIPFLDDDEINGHVQSLTEMAEEFASDASVVLGNASSSGTVRGFPARETRTSDRLGQDALPSFGRQRQQLHVSSSSSIIGRPQPEERHLQILDWIPPRTADDPDGGPSSDSNIFPPGDADQLLSSMDDLEVEVHEKRLTRGISLLEDDKFEEAVRFFVRALKRMEKRSTAPEVRPLINEVKLLLAQSYVGQKQNEDAIKVLMSLVETTNDTNDSVHFSAKHALAELAFNRGDFDEAEVLCLDAAKGRRRLFGTTNTACHASIKLLVEIYKALEELDEGELWKSLLPASELPRHEQFILCDKELRRLCSTGQAEAAAAMGIRFLRQNYEMNCFRPWSTAALEARWTEMQINIRQSDGRGFAGWTAGMCALHFLIINGAQLEIEYLLQQGAASTATFTIPWPHGLLQDEVCTCLMIAALHGQDGIVSMLLKLGAGKFVGPEGSKTPVKPPACQATVFAAAGGHLGLMHKLAAHGVESDQPVMYHSASLEYALLFNQTIVAEWFLQQAATDTYVGEGGQGVVHIAAQGSSVECINMLIARGEPVSSKDRYGYEPIHYAAMFGTPACISCLLGNGANIEAQGSRRLTPLLVAARKGNPSSGSLLISRSANLEALCEDGFTVLERAVRTGRTSFVKMLIEEVPVAFEAWMLRHHARWSPVHMACSKGRPEILRMLLAAAPPSWQIDKPVNRHGNETALHCAARAGDKDCAEILIEKGASVLAQDAHGTPLHTASYHGHIDVLRLLVAALPPDQKTVDVLDRTYKESPLICAARNGKTACVEFLLSKGASVLLKGGDGQTALHKASCNDHNECLAVLISALPPGQSSPDIHGGPDGQTPLMSAASSGALTCVELLLASGASGCARNPGSKTAAHYAAKHGCVDVLELLLRRSRWDLYESGPAPRPLMKSAVLGGHVESVQQLLRLGVPMFEHPNIEREGITIYWYMLSCVISDRKGHRDPMPMALLLSELYAKHCPRWKKSQEKCRSTLRKAIENGNAPLVEVLVDAGFDVDMLLDNGESPVMAALKGGNDEIIRYLRQRGSSLS